MIPYHAEYERAIKYEASEADIHAMMHPDNLDDATRQGRGDHLKRMVLSDALREHGRHAEADLLDNPEQHVVVRDGKIHAGEWGYQDMADHLIDLRRAGHERYHIHRSAPHTLTLSRSTTYFTPPVSDDPNDHTVAVAHPADAHRVFAEALHRDLGRSSWDFPEFHAYADRIAQTPAEEYVKETPSPVVRSLSDAGWRPEVEE